MHSTKVKLFINHVRQIEKRIIRQPDIIKDPLLVSELRLAVDDMRATLWSVLCSGQSEDENKQYIETIRMERVGESGVRRQPINEAAAAEPVSLDFGMIMKFTEDTLSKSAFRSK
jgi:hypothetical protein